jgi:hypothetical protein
MTPIGLAVGETDRFIVKIPGDRNFQNCFDGVVNFGGAIADDLLDPIGQLSEDNLGRSGGELFEGGGWHGSRVGEGF